MRFFVLIFFLTIAACAGREARPIAVREPGDEQKSCRALAIEVALIEQDIKRLVKDSDKLAQNTIFGVTGIFLIVPLAFIDLSNAEREEIEALRARHQHLSVIAVNHGCQYGAHEFGQPPPP